MDDVIKEKWWSEGAQQGSSGSGEQSWSCCFGFGYNEKKTIESYRMARTVMTRAQKEDDNKTSVVSGITKAPIMFQADAEKPMFYSSRMSIHLLGTSDSASRNVVRAEKETVIKNRRFSSYLCVA